MTPKPALIALALAAAVAVPLAPAATAAAPPEVGACNLGMRPPDAVYEVLSTVDASPAGPAVRTALTTACSL